MPTEQYVLERLQSAFPDSTIDVNDYTGTGDHFSVMIQSPRFDGLTRIAQHQLVYKALDGDIGDHSIHALQITARGPS